jgi:hypothetical protein
MQASIPLRTFADAGRTKGAVAFAAAALLAVSAPAARAESLLARYAIKLIGLPLGTATLAGSVDASAYRLEAAARLTGLASVISNAKGAATASGVFVQGRVAPNGFATTSANSQMTRTIRIAMAAGTVRASEIVPPFDSPPDRIPVLESQKRHIIDPLSAFVMPIGAGEQVVGPAACNRTIPIFDSWTRFDVNLAYVGNATIAAKGYSGPVAVCSARYTPVSGHRDRPVTRFMADNRDMEVWLAPLGSARVAIPVRISVATMIGKLLIEATQFETGPASRAALR